MNVGCVVEGETEYTCVPRLLGRLGHVIVGTLTFGGVEVDWCTTFQKKIAPRVKGIALKHPDKIVICADRDSRPQCCGELVAAGADILHEALQEENLLCDFSIIIADRCFESIIFADYDLVDRLSILNQQVSDRFGPSLDGKNLVHFVRQACRPGTDVSKSCAWGSIGEPHENRRRRYSGP